MPEEKNFSSKRVAFLGILLALNIVILYFESVIPTGKLSLYTLSSFFTAVVIMVTGMRAAWVFYGASCILALVLLPDKITAIPYILFFGIYAVFKAFIEKRTAKWPGYALKLIYFNAVLTASYFFARSLFSIESLTLLMLWLIIVSLQIVFLIYDYVFTLFIAYYQTRIKKIIKL